jgi:hypothetical protein
MQKTTILSGLIILASVFIIVGVIIAPPIIKSINTPIGSAKHSEDVEYAPVSEECRKIQYAAAQRTAPLKQAQNAANDELNRLAYRGAAIIPPGNHTVPSNEYLLPDDRPRYDELSKQYFELGNQIEEINIAAACF